MEASPIATDSQYEAFAEAVESARRAAGFSQHDLASELELTGSALSKWGKGNTKPKRVTVLRAERVLGLPVGTLLQYLGYPVPTGPPAPPGRRQKTIRGTGRATLGDVTSEITGTFTPSLDGLAVEVVSLHSRIDRLEGQMMRILELLEQPTPPQG